MNTSIKVAAAFAVAVLASSLLTGCNRQSHSSTLTSTLEARLVETALSSFVTDWGMPGHPEAIPSQCYLQSEYALVSNEDIAAAKAAISGVTARNAIAAISTERTNRIASLRTRCKLSTGGDIEQLEKMGHKYPGGIISVSHVGLAPSGETAAVLLTEARANLAGSTWVIVLNKSTDGWVVVERAAISKS